jgi:hypothetical protein
MTLNYVARAVGVVACLLFFSGSSFARGATVAPQASMPRAAAPSAPRVGGSAAGATALPAPPPPIPLTQPGGVQSPYRPPCGSYPSPQC